MPLDLVIDIGNSRVKGGLFDGKQLVEAFDWKQASLQGKPVQNALISSVNAKAEEEVKKLLDQLKIPYRFLDNSSLKLVLEVDEPKELGADRIANAYGALSRFPINDCIVIDIGTAITADFVVKEGRYLGGMIYPGAVLCAKSLHDYTDKLPIVTVKKTDSALAKTTETHLQTGIYFGQLGAIERMIAELRLAALSPSSVKVIVTGGALQASPELSEDLKDLVDEIDPHLTLKGLREILDEHQKK